MTGRATTTAARREAWNRRPTLTSATPLVRSPLDYLEAQARETRAALTRRSPQIPRGTDGHRRT